VAAALAALTCTSSDVNCAEIDTTFADSVSTAAETAFAWPSALVAAADAVLACPSALVAAAEAMLILLDKPAAMMDSSSLVTLAVPATMAEILPDKASTTL
jgi:hypothetical protein